MRNLTIIESNVEPNKEHLWLYNGNIKYYSSNGWVTLGSYGESIEELDNKIKELESNLSSQEATLTTKIDTNTSNIASVTTTASEALTTAQEAQSAATSASENAGQAFKLANNVNTIIEQHKNDKEIHLPTNGEVQQLLMSNGDGTSKWVTLDFESLLYYGIEFDTTIANPKCTRIGNPEFHRTLPIQSKIRGCLLNDDGVVIKYLNPDTWEGEVLDGSSGQVMVEIPEFYIKFEEDRTKRRVKMSLVPISGYKKINKMYVSAYEATVQHSTSKLCSVANINEDYRGGNNNSSLDGQYNSFLGRPATSISRTSFRSYARKRKSGSTEWNCYTYDVHKTLFWLFVVEYATLNSQASYNSEPTSEGYRQGGLGAGVTTWDSTWSSFNGYYPFVPCGHTDSLGNRTGVVPYTAKNDDESISKTFDVPRYRGVENPFGHIWKWIDGCNIQVSASQENGGTGLSKAFICHNPANFQDSNYANYSHVGNIDRVGGYIKEVLFGVGGEILPKLAGGGSTTYFCDNHWTNIPTSGEALRGPLFGGDAGGGASAGLAYARSDNAPSDSSARFGSRLCFIPNK